MAGRLIIACVSSLAVLAFLLLFGSGSNVEAVTYKIGYQSTFSCAGPDRVYTGGTGDDSCTEDPLYGAYGAGLTADLSSEFSVGSLCDEPSCPDADGVPPWDTCDDDTSDTVEDTAGRRINDGCPAKGPGIPPAPETGAECLNNINDDPSLTDTFINDGCPAVGSPEVYSNFDKLATMGTPVNWWTATDKAIPNGTAVGTMDSLATLGLFGSACNQTLPVTILMYDCTTDNFEGVNDGCPGGAGYGDAVKEQYHHCNDNQDNDGDTLVNEGCPAVGAAETGAECTNDTDDDGDGDPIVAWDPAIDGENLTYGLESDMPKACYKYPNHVNIITEGMQPRARYYGFVIVVPGMAPTQLNFLIFSPEQLTQLGTLPEADMGDPLGYINFVILDNPNIPAGPGGALEEFCSPLSTDTNLWGKTGGQGHLTQDVPPIPGVAGGYWEVTDLCEGTDDNGDTTVDEMCGIVRIRNPEANTGVYGTGSHLAGAYSESNRDADGDTIANNEDECPLIPDVWTPSASWDYIDASCGDIAPCSILTGPAGDADNDGWSNQADNCPCVWTDSTIPGGQDDADEDGIGDACDPNPNKATTEGTHLNDMFMGSVCIGELDTDGDGWCDTTENALGSCASDPCPDPPFTGSPPANTSTPEYYGINFIVRAGDPPGSLDPPGVEDPPGAGPVTCTNYDYYDVNQSHPATPHRTGAGLPVDDDGDTVVNAADPGCDPAWPSGPCTVTIAGDDADCDGADNDVCDANLDEDGDTLVNDGCPLDGDTFADCDANTNGDCLDPGEAALCTEAPATCTDADGVPPWDFCDDDGDTLINDGCPGSPSTDDAETYEADNCPNVVNPTQLDTDEDGVGDACDTNDDDDALTDVKEWRAGSDPKNVCDPFSFDLSGDNKINILDVGKFLNPLKLKPFRPCYPPVDYSVCP